MAIAQLKKVPLVAAFLAAPLFVLSLTLILGQPLSLERMSLPLFLTAGIFYPICEEIIFRGFIQRELLRIGYAQKTLAGLSLANFLTNILFALAHLIVFRDTAALSVFIPGLIFGYFFERHKSLRHPILLHSCYNLMGLLTFSLW